MNGEEEYQESFENPSALSNAKKNNNGSGVKNSSFVSQKSKKEEKEYGNCKLLRMKANNTRIFMRNSTRRKDFLNRKCNP
ncbi:MAG: hypothetical protein KDD45_15765 [Bdellovibrionales bacterium]|nr:hypothetical protein [Bdellovibrionales bacterium]